MRGEFGIAVHALVFLNHKGTRQTSEQIAENVCTNPARIRKVMAALRRAGLVLAQEGAEGGYRTARPADRITLAEVLAATGAPLLAQAWRSGDTDMECLIASGMADAMDGVYAVLNRACERELARITIADMDGKLFGRERG